MAPERDPGRPPDHAAGHRCQSIALTLHAAGVGAFLTSAIRAFAP